MVKDIQGKKRNIRPRIRLFEEPFKQIIHLFILGRTGLSLLLTQPLCSCGGLLHSRSAWLLLLQSTG